MSKVRQEERSNHFNKAMAIYHHREIKDTAKARLGAGSGEQERGERREIAKTGRQMLLVKSQKHSHPGGRQP